MALVLSGSIDISGSMTATTIIVSSPGVAGMVSSSAQITELAPLMAYTASLKGAAIVSSSQQVQNYFTFAQTSSANTTFYGNVTASGNLQANQLYIGGATTSTGLIGASEVVVQNELGIQFGDATGTYMRMIANGANSNTAIVAGAFSGAEPPLDFILGGNTQIRLRADGNNGINTTTPVFTGLTGSLTIRKSYNNDIASVPTTTAQSYYSNQSGLYLFGRNSGLSIISNNSEEGKIVFGNGSTNAYASIITGTGTDAVGGDLYIRVGSDTERLRIGATTGNLTVSTGNVIIGTAGKGIDFSATANSGSTTTSELLDDYEVGTFTPTTAGDATGALGTSTGEYTKIGNVVHFRMACTISTTFTSNTIGGLPFTIGGSGSPSSVQGGLIVFNASATNMIGRMDTAVTSISFFSDTTLSNTLAPTTTMSILRMSGTYRV